MKTSTRTLLLALALVGPVAQAAGPLYLHDSNPPRPLAWDTTKGPIPVWTDGGGAFTYDFDGVTPFFTIARPSRLRGTMPLTAFSSTRSGCFASISVSRVQLTPPGYIVWRKYFFWSW